MSRPDVMKPEMKRQPRITPERERSERADKLVGEVRTRYQERYKEEAEFFGPALSAYRTLLIDFIPTPRPSYAEGLMADNIEAWSQKQGMEFDKDERGNVAAILHGNPNKVIVLQHHLDIVADKTEDSPIDPHTDSIIPQQIEGKLRDLADKEVSDEELWLQAENGFTSLGTDNGAGGAVFRATAERLKEQKEKSEHPEEFPTIIVLGTVEEEAHLGGVKNLSLKPEIMTLLGNADFIINDDMEIDNPRPLAIEGAFGLESMIIETPLEHEPLEHGMKLVQVDLTGFIGGHSGLHAELQHAGVALVKQLEDVLGKPGEQMDWRFSSFRSGNADNAIAETARAVLAIPASVSESVQEKLGVFSESLQPVLKGEKGQLAVSEVASDPSQEILTDGATERAFTLLSDLATLQGTEGTYAFRDQTFYSKAYNMGVVRLGPEQVRIEMSTRIGQQEAFGYYPELVRKAAEKADAEFVLKEPVEIWPPDETSPLPQWLKETYRSLNFEKNFPDLSVEVINAGLELGELHKRFPKSKNITLGIWIDRIHKPGERMQIPSFIENAMLAMKFTDRLVEALQSPSEPTPSRRTTAA